MHLVTTRLRAGLLPTLLTLSLAAPLGAWAQKGAQYGADAPGSKDHPVIQRFAGSWLVGYHHSDWEQVQLPTGMAVKDRKMEQSITLEGKVTRLVYVAPRGKSPLEVYRNYEQALGAAGFQRKFVCERACDKVYFAWYETLDVVNGFRWTKDPLYDAKGGSRYSPTIAMSADDGRVLYGTLSRGGRDLHVLLYNSVAVNGTTEAAATVLTIVEPKAMPTGQVTVDAKALQSGLEAEGKIALYGIYFDTGKAQLKPESKPQLEQMAQLLRQQPALKVYIVGHTDSQGQLDANLTLSQQRAQAVVSALTGEYKVDAKRMLAKGVANLAPVAANTADDGRARNRRVELVVQ
jgi:OOP family OmpA-OmpF porin